MRTQDLDHYERLARRLAGGIALDPDDVERTLDAVGHTREELEKRAQFHRDRQAQRDQHWSPAAIARVEASPLERYQEETKVAGMHEGLAIVVGPMVVLSLFLVALLAALT